MLKKLSSLFILLLVLLSFGSYSQTIMGTVTGAGSPLEKASVSTSGTKGIFTDADGKYSLKLNPGTYNVKITYVGFETRTVTVKLGTEDLVVDVDMVPAADRSEAVILVGSRTRPRTSVSTALPIDNVDAATLKSTGQPTFDKALQYRVPSFNTVNTPVNDATTLVDPYEIRNLGPSRTLILINGKRKNLSALLYVQFAPGRGEVGADLSAIPVDAIKNVEILRDGASAQYGSDAIAGVMNITLKDRYQYSTLNFNSSITAEGDGFTNGLSFNSGSNFGEKGFINYTLAVSKQNNAIRSGIVDLPTEIATFGDPTLPLTDPTNKAIVDYLKIYPTANNRNGTGEISAAKVLINAGLPVGDKGMLYGNAAYVAKKVFSNANYRTPYWRGDFGLLHPVGSTYIGYEPTFEGDLDDYNATLGFKNETNGWQHDVSVTFGGNSQGYSVNNTINRGLGANSPTSFKPGGYEFSHVVGNFDMNKNLNDQFSLGFGTEVRSETFTTVAGDTSSYTGEGANSFPGFREENARTYKRFNLGAYADASLDVTKDFLLNGTVRVEDYSDFGSATVAKFSTRYKFVNDKIVLRGSVSSGFRAPSLQQIYQQSTQAAFVGGTIQLSGLFNNISKQAFLLGIPKLKAEKSTNITLGLGLKPNNNLSITFDYYNIRIKDRVVYSSSITTDDQTTALYDILQKAGVKTVQFFINGIETKTEGLDFVANYKNIEVGKGKLGINVAGNYTLNNEIVGSPNEPAAIKSAGSSILSVQIKSLLTESRPKTKIIFGADYFINKWNFNLNNTLFGKTAFQDLDNGGSAMLNIKQEFKTAVVTDFNIGYNFTKKISASFTVNNLFNILPKWELKALNAAGQTVLDNPTDKNLLEGFLSFSGRYRILGYNGSQFSQLGTIFGASLSFKL
jgi:iron complex outermembrane recepter protein